MSYFNSPAIIPESKELTTAVIAPQPYGVSGSSVSLSDYLRILGKYRKSILLSFLGAVGLTVLLNQALVPRYKAEATMRIDTNPQKILDFDMYSQQKQSRMVDPRVLDTQYNLLRSRKISRQVIDELSLTREQLEVHKLKPFVSEWFATIFVPVNAVKGAIKGLFKQDDSDKPTTQLEPLEHLFLEQLTIKPVKNTQLVDIQFSSGDPLLSANVVNQLIESFIAYNTDSRKQLAVKAEDFLRTELLDTRKKLQASEETLLDYAKKKKIVNTGSNSSILKRNLEDLSSAYIRAKEQRIIAESLYSKKRNVSAAVRATDSPLLGTLKTELANLNSQYQEGLKTFKPQYPAMLALRAQIRNMESQIQRETRSLTSSINNDLKSSFLSALQQEKKLNREIHSYERRLLSFEDKNLHYTNLQRETDANRAIYEGLLQRLKEVGIASSSSSESIELIDSALPPLKSNSPKKGVNLVMGAMLGLLLGLASAFLRNFSNKKISSLEDLERLNLPYPILSSLPKVKNADRKNMALLAVNKPQSPFAESIRYLHTNLTHSANGLPKLLHITSALPSEGKSSIAMNLAVSLAKSGKKVLIIDSDLRRPTLHKHLKIDNSVGLSNFLAGKIEKVPLQKAPITMPLFVIPAGPAVNDPVSLLSNQKMIELCETSKLAFDQIILDSPPVLGLADALVLSNRAEATLFVASSNKPEKGEVLDALKNLEKGFANIIGIAFSKEKSTTTQYYSSFDYSDGRQLLT